MKDQKKSNGYQLTIAWLYPDLMSTYGDRGNVIALQKRCEWRGIDAKIQPIGIGGSAKLLLNCNLVLMGGAEDKQQKIVADDFNLGKDKALKQMILAEIPGLFVCGAYQFLGKYYKEADGTVIKGLGILDIYTESPGVGKKRLIGNIAVENSDKDILLGFENHGGRTFLGTSVQPLGKVKAGFGNNGEDGTEGAIFNNAFGTYMHGPILPKNPLFADFFIQKALEVKYKKEIKLETLDDTLENQARDTIAQKLKIQL